MKSRVFLHRGQCAFCAVLFLVLNLLVASTAFGANTPPGNPDAADRTPLRRRPAHLSHENIGRAAGPRYAPSLAVKSGQPSLAATPAVANPSPPQSDLERFVDSGHNGPNGLVRGVFVPGVLALRVVPPPAGHPHHVPPPPGSPPHNAP